MTKTNEIEMETAEQSKERSEILDWSQPTPQEIDAYMRRARDLRAQVLRNAFKALFRAPSMAAKAVADRAKAPKSTKKSAAV
ncbi:MAG: hypothetical protein AAFW46_03175 [Pseudomonadota bacterium]